MIVGGQDGSHSGDQPAAALETTAAGLSWAIFGTAFDWSRMSSERSPAAPIAAHIATLFSGGLLSVLGSGALR